MRKDVIPEWKLRRLSGLIGGDGIANPLEEAEDDAPPSLWEAEIVALADEHLFSPQHAAEDA